jgi:hypothetical protein
MSKTEIQQIRDDESIVMKWMEENTDDDIK